MHHFTREQYHKLHQIECFVDQRVELIDGLVMDRWEITDAHGACIARVAATLKGKLGVEYTLRVQSPLILDDIHEPLPDVFVISAEQAAGDKRRYSTSLVIEICDAVQPDARQTIQRYQRLLLASLYAASGIAEYWIIDLTDNRVEIFRNAVPDTSAMFGSRYEVVTVLGPNDTVSPLAKPTAQITVSEFLP